MAWKRNMSLQEAAELIDRFLENKSRYPQEWNDFVETRQRDKLVEEYRKRCADLDPLVNRPGEMDTGAVAELRSMIEALLTRATRQG